MKLDGVQFETPLYVKTQGGMAWPEEEGVFYLLTRDGLFLCRNHRFFRSSAPARYGPSELAEHDTGLALRFPKIPRRLIERAVGFFARVGLSLGAEAGALIVWDGKAERVRLVVPQQVATVSESFGGRRSPLALRYEVPADLPTGTIVIGDIHSHVDLSAYSSVTDQDDEVHRAGLHLVVGRIHREPPEFHCEYVVDGARFHVASDLVLEGYERRRRDVPRAWLEKLRVEVVRHKGGHGSSAVGAPRGSSYGPRDAWGGEDARDGWGAPKKGGRG